MTEEIIKAEQGNGNLGIYSSITGDSTDERLAVYTAISNAEKLADHVNEVINVENVILQQVEMTDKETGEVRDAVRTILIDTDGNAYAATSSGIETSIKSILSIVGEPQTWEHPIAFKPVRKQGNNGYPFLTLTVA